MKKDKLYKIEDNERKMIDAFRNAIENIAASGRYAEFVGYEETHKKEGYRIDAVFDYGDFKARLFYNPAYLLFSDYLDVEFDFGGKYFYSIYDIFNLFDIQDFSQYYYSDIQLEEKFYEYVKNVLDVVNKYSYDIRKATEPANQLTLDTNVENDYKRVFAKDTEETWREEMKNPLRLNFVHPYFTGASSATDSQKLYKKMKKAESKGNLDTLYEQRLLRHIEAGNTYVNEEVVKKNADNKQYTKLKVLISISIIVCLLLIFIGIALANYYMNFKGAYIPRSASTLFGIKLPVSLEDCIPFALTVIPLSFGIIGLFSKSILKKISGDNKEIMQKYEMEQKENGNDSKFSRVLKYIVCIGAIVIGLFFGVAVFNNDIGFYDDSVKFNSGILFSTTEISNKDVRIIKILGEYDDDNKYSEYTDTVSYVLCNDKNEYYQLDYLMPDGKTVKHINDIIEKYDKQVEEFMDFESFLNTIE